MGIGDWGLGPRTTMSGVPPRFYLPGLDSDGRGVLDDDEAGHLTRVLRLGFGDEIDVFDGRGGMFRARVEEASRGRVAVQVLEPAAAAPEPALAITLVMSMLKGDKMDAVIRDAVMMGVFAVQPVVSDHGDVSLEATSRGRRWERWQRIAVSSAKQCGRAVVPVIHAPRALTEWITHAPAPPVLVLTEPGAGPGLTLSDLPREPSAHLLIGPEGGWSAEETAAFRSAGFTPVSLGGRTLRADAAPMVAMAAVFERWNGW